MAFVAGTPSINVREVLGADADKLLKHESKTVGKAQLHLPGRPGSGRGNWAMSSASDPESAPSVNARPAQALSLQGRRWRPVHPPGAFMKKLLTALISAAFIAAPMALVSAPAAAQTAQPAAPAAPAAQGEKKADNKAKAKPAKKAKKAKKAKAAK